MELRDSERQYLKRLEAELQGSRHAVAEAESRASALEEQISTSASVMSTPSSQPAVTGPPALAGPGVFDMSIIITTTIATIALAMKTMIILLPTS